MANHLVCYNPKQKLQLLVQQQRHDPSLASHHDYWKQETQNSRLTEAR